MSSRRRGVVYTIQETGTARILFKDSDSFQGTLENRSGEILSLSGCSNGQENLMDIQIVDGEEGSKFRLDGALVRLEKDFLSISHPGLSFASSEKLVGMRALKEIREHMDPRMMEEEQHRQEVYLGHMSISLLTSSYQQRAPARKMSVCEDSTPILEVSNDFLA